MKKWSRSKMWCDAQWLLVCELWVLFKTSLLMKIYYYNNLINEQQRNHYIYFLKLTVCLHAAEHCRFIWVIAIWVIINQIYAQQQHNFLSLNSLVRKFNERSFQNVRTNSGQIIKYMTTTTFGWAVPKIWNFPFLSLRISVFFVLLSCSVIEYSWFLRGSKRRAIFHYILTHIVKVSNNRQEVW